MLRTIAKQNPELRRTLIDLRKAARVHQAPVWAAVAERLARARHQVRPVNVGHLERLAEAEATVVIPGKLLAEGRLTKPLTVAVFHTSSAARLKVHEAGGTVVTIRDLIKSRPDGSGVRLLG
jgi:large subunit ribosomal protein L18e